MSKHTESQIIAMEERLRQAMLNSDVAELDTLIAPELIFTNYLGQLVTKEQDLEIHRSGILDFRELMPSERHIQLQEGFSVVSVKMHILGSYAGVEIDELYRFTRVWAISSGGTLQIIAGHVGVVMAAPQPS
jgi:Domain of unknown function (DUF4440)